MKSKKRDGSSANQANFKPTVVGQVMEIPVPHCIPDPNQPRTEFDEDEMQELMASIKATGLHQPITVNKAYVKDGIQYYYVKYGERRWTAHKRLKLLTVKAFVLEEVYTGEEDISRQINQAAENINRAGHTHREIVVLFRKYSEERRKEKPVPTVSMIQMDFAKMFGKSLPWVQNYSALVNLDVELMKKVDVKTEDALPFTVAVSLGRAPKEEQGAILLRGQAYAKGNRTRLQSFVVQAVRDVREKRGEGIRGMKPGESRQMMNRIFEGAVHGFERLAGTRKKKEFEAWLTDRLRACSVSEVDILLQSINAAAIWTKQFQEVAQKVRDEKYRPLSVEAKKKAA
jgi:ParB/RepB/Spo0J family partition protein